MERYTVGEVIDALATEAPHTFPDAWNPNTPRDFGNPNNPYQFRTDREATARSRAASVRNREEIILKVSERLARKAADRDRDADREVLLRTAPELRNPENREVMRRWLDGDL